MTHTVKGLLNKVLEVDLTLRTVSTVDISMEDRLQYLGGKGLGLKLLYDRLIPGIDPLGKDNIIVITTGVVAGTGTPCSGRFHAVFKSPLTGIIGSSSCGGSFGRQLKTCGYDGIIIRGRATDPSMINICDNRVEFLPADHLWGLDIDRTQKQIDEKLCQSLVIGPAGENLVWFANAASGHRYLGRGGIGAVMGSKNLKALIVQKGSFKISPVNEQKFKRLKHKATLFINRNKMSLLNREFGTASNTKPVIANRMLPVHNFRYGTHKDAVNLTGQSVFAARKTRFSTCHPCSIMCGHKGFFNDKETQVPEYETLALLGSSIGIFDPDQISSFNDICNARGMDTISAGGTLAWVMEATQKGLIDTPLKFGSAGEIPGALESIAALDGFGEKMAKGTRWLSRTYGGNDFAIQCKGLEMAGYDPRGAYGQGLGYAVANRGACHLSSFPVAFENFLGYLKPDTVKSKADFVVFFEDIYCALNSLGICQFTGYAFTLEPFLSKYTPKAVLGFLMQHLAVIALSLVDFSLFPAFFEAVTGMKMSSGRFKKAGQRIHVLERYMNSREGISKKDDVLPERLTGESQADDPSNRMVPLDRMIDRYYQKRGYDQEGRPKEQLLKSLGIKY